MPKLVCKISTRQFWCRRYTTFWKASLSWQRHNKGISWCKLENNNTWDRWEIKFIEFNCLWPFEKRSYLINRKGVMFHQDNVRSHISLVTRQKLLRLEWDTLSPPPYSTDLEPSNYYLFRSLENFLDGKMFTSNEEVKNPLDQFFAIKDRKILWAWNHATNRKMEKVLYQNSQYIIY